MSSWILISFFLFLVLVFTKQAMALIFGHYDKWHASIVNCFIVANVGESHSNGIYLEDPWPWLPKSASRFPDTKVRLFSTSNSFRTCSASAKELKYPQYPSSVTQVHKFSHLCFLSIIHISFLCYEHVEFKTKVK